MKTHTRGKQGSSGHRRRHAHRHTPAITRTIAAFLSVLCLMGSGVVGGIAGSGDGAVSGVNEVFGTVEAQAADIEFSLSTVGKLSEVYYSAAHYNAASQQMIDTVLGPMVIYLKQTAAERGYSYSSEEALKKDAALIYMMSATVSDLYKEWSYTCENFAAALNGRTNCSWVGGTPIANVETTSGDNHAWNIIEIDGNKYDLEPQSGTIYIDNTDPKLIDRMVRIDYPSPVYTERGALLNYCTKHCIDEIFRLNPLLVLKTQHPEIFKNLAVLREFCTNDPEIYFWQSAWYSAKYHNNGKSDKKINNLLTYGYMLSETPAMQTRVTKEDVLRQLKYINKRGLPAELRAVTILSDEKLSKLINSPGDYYLPEEALYIHIDGNKQAYFYASDGVNKWPIETTYCNFYNDYTEQNEEDNKTTYTTDGVDAEITAHPSYEVDLPYDNISITGSLSADPNITVPEPPKPEEIEMNKDYGSFYFEDVASRYKDIDRYMCPDGLVVGKDTTYIEGDKLIGYIGSCSKLVIRSTKITKISTRMLDDIIRKGIKIYLPKEKFTQYKSMLLKVKGMKAAKPKFYTLDKWDGKITGEVTPDGKITNTGTPGWLNQGGYKNTRTQDRMEAVKGTDLEWSDRLGR